jgi:putative thioredoxin
MVSLRTEGASSPLTRATDRRISLLDWIREKRMSTAWIFDVNEQNFEQRVIQSSQQTPVLVDFWAEWCAPCRVLTPVLEHLADDYQGRFLLARIDTDREPGIAAAFQVRSLPTLKLFYQQSVVAELIGVQPEPVIRQMLDEFVARDSDRLRDRARALLEAGDKDGAAGLLREALQRDPDNHRIHPQLADVLIQCGDFDGASKILDQLPISKQRESTADELRGRINVARSGKDGGADIEALEQAVTEDPNNSEARYQLAMARVREQDYAAGLAHLLELVKRDREYGDDAARKAMLDVFNVLGSGHALVGEFRPKLSSALF